MTLYLGTTLIFVEVDGILVFTQVYCDNMPVQHNSQIVKCSICLRRSQLRLSLFTRVYILYLSLTRKNGAITRPYQMGLINVYVNDRPSPILTNSSSS